MKILLVNTHEKKGGAGVASNRLFAALKRKTASIKLLVQYKKSSDSDVISVSRTWTSKLFTFLRFALERSYFMLMERSADVRFMFSTGNTGIDITNIDIVKNSDLIHLHWINQGFLSIDSLQKLKKTGKPIVWTLHDMWAFTGGCHYSGMCTGYQVQCGSCPFLRNPSPQDISHQVWLAKEKAFQDFAQLTIVTCSNWLMDLAAQSSLFRNKKIVSIPNCIDTTIFTPQEKSGIRKKLGLPITRKTILFGAMNTSDKRKGFQYLVEALVLLKKRYPEINDEISLVVFGKSEPQVLSQLSFAFYDLKIISSQQAMVDAYCIADVFVIPSLEDNLPNTIMESLSCGVPVVAFETGGIPEMISHKNNGYLAKYRSAEDLADGLYWTLFEANAEILSLSARDKVLKEYSMDAVADKYLTLYESLR